MKLDVPSFIVADEKPKVKSWFLANIFRSILRHCLN